MTKAHWLAKVHEHRDKLRGLILGYHPFYRRSHSMPITAPNAESACRAVREAIAQETVVEPVLQFDAALNIGDVYTIYHLLNDVWFGVPESINCWRIEGFRQAVELIEDFVDDKI